MNGANYIDVQDIKLVFRKDLDDVGVTAIDGLSFGVKKSEFVSVLGPSGCGKTTLLRIMDGLIKPERGRIVIDGKPVTGPGFDRAMVFQDFGLLPWRNALENVEMGLEFQGKPKSERRQTAMEKIQMVGMAGFESYYPHQLSGGMRQRIGLARALSVNPDIFLMDEPFGSLDAQTRELMQEELLKLWNKFKGTVVFITHSIDEAIYLSDRVIIVTARPGKLRTEMIINLPRPRWEYNVRATMDFLKLRDEAWSILRAEILRAAEIEERKTEVPTD